MIGSDKTDQVIGALVKAQVGIHNPTKDATNPAFKSTYSTLPAVLAVINPALAEHGLKVLQAVGMDEARVTVKTTILHSSGQWLEVGVSSAPLAKQDAQGVGSCITYLRRYSLLAAFGIAPDDDDDGNAASSSKPAARGISKPQANTGKFSEGQIKRTMAIANKLFNLSGDPLAVRVREAASKILDCEISSLTELGWKDGKQIMDALEAEAIKKGVWQS